MFERGFCIDARGKGKRGGGVDAYTVGDLVHGERFLGQGWRLGGLVWVAATRTVDFVFRCVEKAAVGLGSFR